MCQSSSVSSSQQSLLQAMTSPTNGKKTHGGKQSSSPIVQLLEKAAQTVKAVTTPGLGNQFDADA